MDSKSKNQKIKSFARSKQHSPGPDKNMCFYKQFQKIGTHHLEDPVMCCHFPDLQGHQNHKQDLPAILKSCTSLFETMGPKPFRVLYVKCKAMNLTQK